jgi:hypothetical protein
MDTAIPVPSRKYEIRGNIETLGRLCGNNSEGALTNVV